MAIYKPTNTDRALMYGESELGEVAILRESDQTYTIINAKTKATVLAAGQSVATIQARVAAIHPAIAKVTG